MLSVLVAAIFATIDPLLMRQLVDSAVPKHHLTEAVELAVGIASCFLGRYCFNAFGSFITFSIAQVCARALKLEMLEQMNRLSDDYHSSTPTGEKIMRIGNDVDEIATLGADTTNQVFKVSLLIILNLVMMMKLSVRLTLVVLPLFPIFVFVQRHYRTTLERRARDVRSEAGSAISLLTEFMGAVPQIQVLSAEPVAMARSTTAWDALLSAEKTQRGTQIRFSLMIGVVLASAILSVLAVGSVGATRQLLSIGTLVAFYSYIGRVFDPVGAAMDLYTRIQAVGASIQRIRDLLALEPTVVDGEVEEIEDRGEGYLLSHVSVTFGQKKALQDIELQIGLGERVAIVGPSGSGKSSLARLLARVADPTTGAVTLQGRPISLVRLRTLRQVVAYVPQFPSLFRGTIRENLLLADEAATVDQLDAVLEIVQFRTTLDRLSNGLDTAIGSGGVMLSGGEQQRVAIARAILREPAILIMDEATSALDGPTERALFMALCKARPNLTLILISHRVHLLTWGRSPHTP